MTVALRNVRVGEPLRFDALSVFPLFCQGESPLEYILSDEAMAQAAVLVSEVGEAGSVPEVFVENQGDTAVLFLEGEELTGAKQNRVLNTSVLVAARSRIKVPVSCIERGRWGYSSPRFRASRWHAPAKLRSVLRGTATAALHQGRSHRSHQGRVWRMVAEFQECLGVQSPTGSMADTFASHKERIHAFQENLRYVEGAAGLAVCLGKDVVCLDLFDKSSTCREVWDRLISGFALDAMERGTTEAADVPEFLDEHRSRLDAMERGTTEAAGADVGQVESTLTALAQAPWQKVPAVAQGEEYRAQTATGGHAFALTCEQWLVHGGVVAAPTAPR
jgi:hypothetical protein